MTIYGRATLTVGDTVLSDWSEYEIASDLLTPASGFSFAVQIGGERGAQTEARHSELRALLAPGQRVSVQIEAPDGVRMPQLEGIIDDLDIDPDVKGGVTYKVGGRDLAAYLTDSDAPLDLLTQADSTLFVDVLQAAVDPWGLTVSTDAAASRDLLTGRAMRTADARLSRDRARGSTGARARRSHANGQSPEDVAALTIQQAKPRPGQTVWDYLSTHAARLQLMLWMSADGRLIVGSPNYDQTPSARFVRRWDGRGNNVITGPVKRTLKTTYSIIEVYGRGGGGDAARSAIRATAISPALSFDRRLVVHDQSIRTQEQADARAQRELMRSELGSVTLSYTVEGHGQHPLLYAIDTVADVDDELAGVAGRYYMVGRRFRQARQAGTTSVCSLVPEGAIQL